MTTLRQTAGCGLPIAADADRGQGKAADDGNGADPRGRRPPDLHRCQRGYGTVPTQPCTTVVLATTVCLRLELSSLEGQGDTVAGCFTVAIQIQRRGLKKFLDD